MKANWTIIPEINRISESLSLAEEYGTAFEYNDFFWPYIYEDATECNKRIRLYKSLERDKSRDTIHGAFFDVVAFSKDTIIREHSRKLMDYSMYLAQELECKGVVFHTGLIAGLTTEIYIDDWIKQMSLYLQKLTAQYPNIMIYVENTAELTPIQICEFMKEIDELKNVKLCLDYAHAVISPTPVEEWVKAFAGKLGHIHINDNDLKNDSHMPPGSGKIDYSEFDRLTKSFREDERINTLIEVNGIENQRKALEFLTGF